MRDTQDGKGVVLITGASSGIGAASARWFWARGWRLVLWARRMDRLHLLKAGLLGEMARQDLCSQDIWLGCVDVRDHEAVQQAYKDIPSNLTPVDVLLNNAGLSQGLQPVHGSDPLDVDRVVDTNLKGLIHVTRAVVPAMQARGKGQVIHVSSTAGKETYPGGGIYCASKFAVEAIAKSMRQELLPYGIKVGTVSPGMVETEFSLVRFKGDTQKAEEVYRGLDPLMAEDVAEAVGFMATRPEHVQVADLILMPRAQAGSGMLHRREG